jgi:tight adherence protein B
MRHKHSRAAGARRRATGLVSLVAATALASVGVIIGAGTASAAPEGRIVAVDSDGAAINVVFSATGLAAGQSIDPESVTMRVGGVSIPSEAKAVGSEGSEAPVAVLTMDVSGSMQGARLTAAKRAANEFLRTVPPATKVGLVTFSDTAQERVKPTTDRGAVADVIAGLTAEGDTALYDATILSTRTVGRTGPRTIVLFSDGADTSSKADLRGAQAAVKTSGAVLDAVSLGTDAAQVSALNALAASGNGQVIATTNLTQLTEAFTEAARDITNQVTIVGKVPADLLGTAGNVAVAAEAGDTAVSDIAFVSIPTAAPVEPVTAKDFGPVVVEQGTSPFSNPFTIGAGALLLFAGLATLLTFALRSSTASERREQKVTRKLSIYTLSGRSAVQTSETTADWSARPFRSSRANGC